MKPARVMFGALLTTVLLEVNVQTRSEATELGLFAAHGDVGGVSQPGAAQYDAERKSYLVTGGGENMWFTNDAFHYVWKRVSGDLSLAADIRWEGTNGNPHRKACLLIRQTLAPDSPYVDVAVHGDGLTSLQYRESQGGPTQEIQATISKPARVRLEKRGGQVSLSVAAPGETLRPAGASFRIQFAEPFYIGLAVCAHDNRALERAEFRNVELAALLPTEAAMLKVTSTLEVIAISSKDRRVVYHTSDHVEAPNWSPDGQYFVFNNAGRLFKLPVTGGQPQLVDTGFAVHCNNDHGISPDGAQLVISDQTQDKNRGFTRFQSMAARRVRSRRARRLTGTVGRRTAGHWPTVPNATVNSTSTPFQSRAAKKGGSRRHLAWTTDPSIRRMEA